MHREIAEFLDPRIHEAAPGTPSFALHSFRIDDREYVMDCLPTTGLMAGYRIVETGELVSVLQCDKGVSVVRTGVDENGVAVAWLYATDSNGETGPEFSLPIEALKVGVFR